MDALALASVITAGVAAVSTGINAYYNTARTAKTAKEGRAEQRAADGYLNILSLAEREAQWLDARVYNFGLDHQELEWGIVVRRNVPEPAITDRATSAALIAAFGSVKVMTSHAEWRSAADQLAQRLDGIAFSMQEDGDPYANVPEDWMRELKEEFLSSENIARKGLADTVAAELGHRQRPARRFRLPRGRNGASRDGR